MKVGVYVEPYAPFWALCKDYKSSSLIYTVARLINTREKYKNAVS